MNQKQFFIALVLILLMNCIIMPQNKSTIQPISEIAKKSYPIDGTPLLQKEYESTAKYLKAHPDYFSKTPLRKTSWSFTVGSTHSWWSANLSTGLYYLVPSTCRAVNKYSYVFVEDAQWGMTVNQAAVDSVSRAFDQSTPADPTKGIYQTDVDDFGNPPDVDSDQRIIILILDIKDGFSGVGGYIAGYFNPTNEINTEYSNNAEIYYVDCNPTDLTTAGGITLAMGTTAHEFQHMINWNYHKTNPELTFINEGLSQQATDNCGYPLDFDSYLNDESKPLFSWGTTSDVVNDYSRTARYFVYLKNQFGIGLSKRIVQDSVVGIAGLQNALQGYGVTESLNQIFTNWCIANAINDKTTNPAYGYDNKNITKVLGTSIGYPNVNKTSQLINNYGVSYLNYKIGSNLKMIVNSNSNLVVKAIEKTDSTVKVSDVQLGQQFSEPLFGSTYNDIEFAIINIQRDSAGYYSYQSSADLSGETELKWDVKEPIGYYVLSTKDTVSVVFDSFPGGILDSIRVALRRPGSITGGVWQSTGQLVPTLLGKPLAVPITANISTETSVPYPVPYNNWATIDVRSYSINTDSSFVVGFAIGKVPNTPGIMVTYYPGTSPYYSFTYLQTSDNISTPGWYYFTNPTSDSVSIYLIRAYAHYKTTAVTKEVELIPSKFSVAQNYPNPFNPSTIISYSIPIADNVTVEIYNLLGQKVSTLINEFQNAGEHNIVFNANNLSSGMYIYVVHDGNLEISRKMLLLK